MRKTLAWMALALSILTVSTLAQATTLAKNESGLKHSCSFVPGTLARYCVTETLGSTNPDVIFYFHCLFGDENNWLLIPQYQIVRERWAQENFQAPTVITISYGPAWLVAPKGESPKSGLYEEIRDKVFPYITKKIESERQVPLGQKTLLGLSLGGPNAAEFYLHASQTYARVALLCPGLSKISPYASDEEVQAYIDRNNADPAKVYMALSIARDYFSPLDWEQNSPLKLAPRLMSRKSAELLVFAGKTDSFGFYEGPLAFFEAAQKNGASATFVENEKGHCYFPPAMLADFLSGK